MLVVFWIAIAFGFYMAWSIGANDAANAMGTSVGSGAVSFKEAVIIAAVFEFAGAFLAGADVTDTMRNGIIDPAALNMIPDGGKIFAIGMLAALMSSAIWLHIAAFLGWPVSTTHSIVGAIAGFGTVALGVDAVQWSKLGSIVASWGISPILGGLISFTIFLAIRKLILDTRDPVASVRRWGAVFSFPVFVVLALVLFFKGLKNAFQGDTLVLFGGAVSMTSMHIYIATAVISVVTSLILAVILRRMDLSFTLPAKHTDSDVRQASRNSVEKVFRYLQVLTACFVAFAHGSNDVANSIGPLAAIVGLFQDMKFVGAIGAKVPVPTWVLLLGGAGIVIGLATYGRKVIETIGNKITEMTPSRGFAAEFGAAATILMGSKLGLPLSTTHTVVGAVIGVGFARGMNALNLSIIVSIIKSWLYTIPFTALLTIALFYVLRFIFI